MFLVLYCVFFYRLVFVLIGLFGCIFVVCLVVSGFVVFYGVGGCVWICWWYYVSGWFVGDGCFCSIGIVVFVCLVFVFLCGCFEYCIGVVVCFVLFFCLVGYLYCCSWIG